MCILSILDSIKLATVATIGRVLRAVKYWLLPASMWSHVGIRCWRHWLNVAGAFNHGEDVRLVVI